MEEENKPVEGETVVVAAVPEAPATSKYEDKTLICVECGKPFVWTARDQEFYAENNYKQPKRCKACREINKARIANYRKEHREAYESSLTDTNDSIAKSVVLDGTPVTITADTTKAGN